VAKKQSYPAPFGDPVDIETDTAVTIAELTRVCRGRAKGVSIRVRTAAGTDRRGGYLFHFAPHDRGFVLFDYRKRHLHRFDSLDQLLVFVNHVAGRQFDEAILDLCDEINRKVGEAGANP